MCLEIEDRYQLIVIARDPREIVYRTDQCRTAEDDESLRRHEMVRSFVEHFLPEKLLFVEGEPEGRLVQVELRLGEMRKQSV